MQKHRILFSFFLIFSFIVLHAAGECVSSQKFGYMIDFPEGAQIEDMTEDESIVLMSHKYFKLKTLLRVWPADKYVTSSDALKDSMKKLGAECETTDCIWHRQNCTIAMFTGAIEGTQSSGWAEVIPLPEKKGWLLACVYASSDVAENIESAMISILDSVMPDWSSMHESGIITSTFYPSSGPEAITLKIGNRKISSVLDKSDSEANQFVIDREWNIFKIYAQHLDINKAAEAPVLISAWQRFYRLTAKDSMARLSKVSDDIYMDFMSELTSTQSDNELKVAQELLTWTQGFEYKRNDRQTDKADFTNLIDVLKGTGNDCDSRSMLLAVLLKNMGMDTCFFISPQYGHAMFGIHLDGKAGQTIKIDSTEYLVGETTAKDVTIGMMSADMTDRKFWYPVEFY